MQENILKSYQQQFPKNTFLQISKQTGIQITRIFRIFNGSEMKINEYFIFKDLLENSKGVDEEFRNLFEFALTNFPVNSLEELKDYLDRKQRVFHFKNTKNIQMKAA